MFTSFYIYLYYYVCLFSVLPVLSLFLPSIVWEGKEAAETHQGGAALMGLSCLPFLVNLASLLYTCCLSGCCMCAACLFVFCVCSQWMEFVDFLGLVILTHVYLLPVSLSLVNKPVTLPCFALCIYTWGQKSLFLVFLAQAVTIILTVQTLNDIKTDWNPLRSVLTSLSLKGISHFLTGSSWPTQYGSDTDVRPSSQWGTYVSCL